VEPKAHELNGHAPAGDRVELSDRARWLDRLRQLPEVRTELVETVRQSIVDGTYETPEKIGIAVEHLLEELVE
jgi:negative regulator of flagellin synthesis FlgM